MNNLDSETIQCLQKIADNIHGSAEYAQIMQSALDIQNNMFVMLDRSLTIMQALHTSELKNTELSVDVIKFLLPLFASAVITGATVNLPNINSAALMGIGGVVTIALLLWLIVTLLSRRSLIKKQNKQYAKLSSFVDEMRKVAELQQKTDHASIDESTKAIKKILEMQEEWTNKND